MTDLRFRVAETMFALRVGMICLHDGHLLVVAGDHLDFRYLPGGAVKVGEEAAEAAAREWREETGLDAGPLRLLGIVENFFVLNGMKAHEVGFYFQVTLTEPLCERPVADQPSEHLEWLPLERLSEARVYPAAISDLLNVPVGEIRHLVQRD